MTKYISIHINCCVESNYNSVNGNISSHDNIKLDTASGLFQNSHKSFQNL